MTSEWLRWKNRKCAHPGCGEPAGMYIGDMTYVCAGVAVGGEDKWLCNDHTSELIDRSRNKAATMAEMNKQHAKQPRVRAQPFDHDEVAALERLGFDVYPDRTMALLTRGGDLDDISITVMHDVSGETDFIVLLVLPNGEDLACFTTRRALVGKAGVEELEDQGRA